MSKRAKHRDAGMTSILVKRFKMGQIDVEDLEQMAADTIRPERCLATKKVLIALRDSPDLSGSPESHSSPYPLLQNAKSEVSNHIQHLHAQFLGLRLPDLIRHPGRSALGLITRNRWHVNMYTFLVPCTRSPMSLWPRLAAFKAAWRGNLLGKNSLTFNNRKYELTGIGGNYVEGMSHNCSLAVSRFCPCGNFNCLFKRV